MIKQSSKLKKCQGCTLEGLGPGGAPQARGRERGESRHLIKWRIRMSAEPAAGSLLPCQAHDPRGEAVPCPQTPMHLLLQKKALPEQWVLRHKKAEWRLGNAHPAEGVGISSTGHQEPEAGTLSPKGEQGELDLIFLKTGKLIFSLKK